MPELTIGGRAIGKGHPPYVIAESGINHNGEIDKALEMIRAAKSAGADAIKFQTFKAEEFVGDPSQTYTYTSQGKEVTESMMAMFKRYEFSPSQWRTVRDGCKREGVTFLSTPQNRPDLDLLLDLGIEAIKVGSDDFTNLPLLKDYASTGLPMIISCGMADMDEVHQALQAVGAFNNHPTVLLYCVSQYPAPPTEVNLRKMETLIRTFPDIPIGFSDHTQGPLASSLAVAMGACLLEKHFTLDHGLPGPDHWFSEDIEGLSKWVSAIRTSYEMLGEATLRPTPAELQMRDIARRSVVAIKDIAHGEPLDHNNIGLRRPGIGIPPSQLEHVLGGRATRAIAKGSMLSDADFSKRDDGGRREQG